MHGWLNEYSIKKRIRLIKQLKKALELVMEHVVCTNSQLAQSKAVLCQQPLHLAEPTCDTQKLQRRFP